MMERHPAAQLRRAGQTNPGDEEEWRDCADTTSPALAYRHDDHRDQSGDESRPKRNRVQEQTG